jgi:hypothetical protein
MQPRVYVETSIPSFYHEGRTAPDMIARRDWTRDWWDNHRQGYLLVTSEAVLDELTRGDFPNKENALANANKFDHIGRVNMLLGLYVPKLVTPLELLGG